MKNIKKYLVSFGTLIVALFLGLQMAFAQTPLPQVEYSQDWQQQVNHVFEHLNLKYVPSGLLADYSFSFAKLSHYTGTPTDSSFVTMQALRRIYATLQSAKVHQHAQINTIAEFNSSVQTESQRVGDNGKDAVALISVLYQYHRLKPTAITGGLLTVSNGQLFNAYPTVYDACYEKQLLFALSPTQNIFKTKNIRFTLTEVDWTNLGGMSYEIDFGDGQGFRSLPRLQQFAINYPTAGLKTLVSRVTLPDGTQAESKSHIWIQTTPIASRISTHVADSSLSALRLRDNPDQIVPIVATRAYQGVFGRATIEIGLGDDRVFDHPLIVIEGFDPSRWIPAVGDYNYVRFRRAINTDIPAFFLEDGLTTTRNYDIVFVNFADGTDFIQRNAYVVQEVIRWVNRNKVNNPTTGQRESNVVLGESMGGLVGRYALAEMERPTDRRPSENHEVCQFYSHDSPHQGAYAPVAGQAALYHAVTLGVGVGLPHLLTVGIGLSDIIPELRGVWNMAHSPAARQMSKERVNSLGSSLVHVVSQEHQVFMTEYNQMGYPTRCRNISISNGSHQGAGQPSPIPQYGEMVRIAGSGSDHIGLSSPIFAAFAFFQIDFFASINWAAVATFLPFPGSNEMEVEVILNALPHRQVRRVYGARVTQVRRILWLIPIRSHWTRRTMHSRPNCIAWENAPGGQYQLPNITNPANINLSNWFVSANSNVALNLNGFCFVPTISSLDLGGAANPSNEDIYTPIPAFNSTVTAPLPFDIGYSTFMNNEVHIAFNFNNATWWLNQLDTRGCNAVNCNGLDQLAIDGNNFACESPLSSYTINLPLGATSDWTLQPNNIATLTDLVQMK